MTRMVVASSNIDMVGYEKLAKTLEVTFRTGMVYCYFDVPESVYSDFLAAESKGKFFNAYVKNKFNYARVGHVLGMAS